MKKVKLRMLMYIQAIVAFCIPLYYHLMIAFKINSNVPLLAAIVILIVVDRLKQRSEVMDEYAKKALQYADSICFKMSILIMGILVLPFLFFENENVSIVGYLLTMGIFVLILVRACIFCWIDKRGME